MGQTAILIFPAGIATTITSSIFLFAGLVNHDCSALMPFDNCINNDIFIALQITRAVKYMHKVTNGQMDGILACMNHPVDGAQDAIFEALNLNPYDHYEDNNPDFVLVVRESLIESHLYDLLNHPDAYLDEDDSRYSRLTNGKKLNSDEIEQLRAEYIEQQRHEEDAEYMVVTSLIDEQERAVFVAYSEMAMGQGGINIVEFFGFYATEEEATRACQNIEGLIVDKF